MENVKIKRVGSKLIVEIDLDHEGDVTSGGKGVVVAKTRGYIPLTNKETGEELGNISLHMWKRFPREEKVSRKLGL